MISPSAKTLTAMSDAIRSGRSLWVRTSAGPKIGFGHLRRCIALADILQAVRMPLFLLDSDDLLAGGEITRRGWAVDYGGLDKVWEALPYPTGVLIDTRRTDGLDPFISTARALSIPVISIHDFGLCPVASDVAIDGSAIPVSKGDFPFNGKLYSGTDFMVLDAAYGSLNDRSKPIRENIRTVFVNLGGGDSSRYFPAILEGLRLWGQEIEVIGLPGFVSWGQETLGRRDWHPLHFRWETENVQELLYMSDLAITAGGLSAYEALCTGTPLAALSYDELQQRTISTLAAKGVCLDLGAGAELDPVILSKMIASLNSEMETRRKLSACSRELIDGRGAERVARIILQTIHGDLAESAGRGNVSRAGL
jgi:UDP-2,4-diacetamido-2,4,6-trideoxy-beta-L-altropyranose hydrolase